MIKQSDFIQSRLSELEEEQILSKSFNHIFTNKLKKRYAQLLSEKLEQVKLQRKAKLIYRLKVVVSVAACFLIALLTFNTFIGDKMSTELLASHYINETVFENAELLRGGEATDINRIKAHEFYVEKRFDQAILSYEQITDKNQIDVFFLGMAYMYMSDYQKAISNFESMSSNSDFKYSEELKWFSALSYIKQGNLEDAKSQLSLINSWKKEEAEALLSSMK